MDELLAQVATDSAPTTAAATGINDINIEAATATAAPVTTGIANDTVDIEDYYAPPQSSPRVSRVLGREQPGATWRLNKTESAFTSQTRIPKPGSGDGSAALG